MSNKATVDGIKTVIHTMTLSVSEQKAASISYPIRGLYIYPKRFQLRDSQKLLLHLILSSGASW